MFIYIKKYNNQCEIVEKVKVKRVTFALDPLSRYDVEVDLSNGIVSGTGRRTGNNSLQIEDSVKVDFGRNLFIYKTEFPYYHKEALNADDYKKLQEAYDKEDRSIPKSSGKSGLRMVKTFQLSRGCGYATIITAMSVDFEICHMDKVIGALNRIRDSFIRIGEPVFSLPGVSIRGIMPGDIYYDTNETTPKRDIGMTKMPSAGKGSFTVRSIEELTGKEDPARVLRQEKRPESLYDGKDHTRRHIPFGEIGQLLRKAGFGLYKDTDN